MKIAITSDLHMEFKASQLPRLEERVDVLILAGDIDSAKNVNDTAVAVANGNADHILVVAGNHEFYGTRWDKGITALRASPDITFLENDMVEIDGIVFVGATLWTDFDLNGNAVLDMFRIENYMNDFRRIKYRDPANGAYRRMLPKDMRMMHFESRNYIRDMLEKTEGKRQVVITHHAPNALSIDEQYLGEWSNCGYASNVLDGYFPEPLVWFHGHMHMPVNYMAGNTRVLSNPRGYPQEFGDFQYEIGIVNVNT